MIKAVLDVNILVSAALNGRGLPARIVDLATEVAFNLVVSDHIIESLRDVLQRPYFLTHLPAEGSERLLRLLATKFEDVAPDPSVRGIAPDLEDDLVLGTAVKANADFLVTGDKGLLAIGEYRGVRIVTAEAFLRELEIV